MSPLLTCPLVFHSPYMSIAEVPVLSQNLPLSTAEVLGGQAPQNRAKMLCLQLVVLLEAEGLPHTQALLTYVILNTPGEQV